MPMDNNGIFGLIRAFGAIFQRRQVLKSCDIAILQLVEGLVDEIKANEVRVARIAAPGASSQQPRAHHRQTGKPMSGVQHLLSGGEHLVGADGDETLAARISTFFTSFSCGTCRSAMDDHMHLLNDLPSAILPPDSAPALFRRQNEEDHPLLGAFYVPNPDSIWPLSLHFSGKNAFCSFCLSTCGPKCKLRDTIALILLDIFSSYAVFCIRKYADAFRAYVDISLHFSGKRRVGANRM